MTLTRVPVKDFRGGLNTRDSPFELSANESPDLLNVTVSSLVGQLETRKGKTRYDVSGLPEGESIDHAKQVAIGSLTPQLMLSINGNIWVSNNKGEIKKLHTGTAGTVWTFEVFADVAFKDWVWCSNGVDTPQKYGGITGETVEWKPTIGALPVGTVLRVWENRMFISGVGLNPQRIYFSEFGDPEATIKEYGFVDVRGTESDLDAVQDLAVLGSRLIVLKRQSVFFISSAVTMANRRIGGPGVWGRFQTVELEDKLYFFNAQGIWSTGGVTITMESGSINNYFPKNLNLARLGRACMIATKDTYPRLLLAFCTGTNTSNDTMIEMVPHINFRRIGGRRYLLLPAFFLHSLACSTLATWNPTESQELIIGAGTTNNASAGVTTFPNVPIVDSFIRADENPLSNGGKWSKLIQPEGIGGASPLQVSSNILTAFGGHGAARWNKEEFTSPAAEVEIAGEETGLEFRIFVCAGAPEVFANGYELAVTAGIFPGESTVELRKWVAGVKTSLKLLEKLPTYKAGDRLGITVIGGKVRVWQNIAGKGWTIIIEVADAAFTKGYTALAVETFPEAITEGVRNFRTEGIPATANRLSTLFTGTTDEGEEISAHWHSSWMVLQGEEPKERVRRVNVELQGDAVLDVFTDFSELPKFSKTVPKGVAEGSEYRFERVRPETWGRFHSVKLRSLAGGSPFLVNTMEVVYRGGKEP